MCLRPAVDGKAKLTRTDTGDICAGSLRSGWPAVTEREGNGKINDSLGADRLSLRCPLSVSERLSGFLIQLFIFSHRNH